MRGGRTAAGPTHLSLWRASTHSGHLSCARLWRFTRPSRSTARPFPSAALVATCLSLSERNDRSRRSSANIGPVLRSIDGRVVFGLDSRRSVARQQFSVCVACIGARPPPPSRVGVSSRAEWAVVSRSGGHFVAGAIDTALDGVRHSGVCLSALPADGDRPVGQRRDPVPLAPFHPRTWRNVDRVF